MDKAHGVIALVILGGVKARRTLALAISKIWV